VRIHVLVEIHGLESKAGQRRGGREGGNDGLAPALQVEGGGHPPPSSLLGLLLGLCVRDGDFDALCIERRTGREGGEKEGCGGLAGRAREGEGEKEEGREGGRVDLYLAEKNRAP